MMPIVYESGPISGSTATAIAEHIHAFAFMENWLLREGYAAINPANDFEAAGLGGLEYEMYMQKDKAFVSVSAAILMLPGWRESRGARRELRWARQYGLIVAYSMEQLKKLLPVDHE
jgi:hypothetical protein